MIDTNMSVLVVGAGLMGSGIAHAFAISGFATRLVDTQNAVLNKAETNIYGILDTGVKLGKLGASSAAEAKARLSTSTDLAAAARGVHLVVETVVEQLATKQQVMRTVAPLVAEGAILATNSSALSVTEVATALPQPGCVIGMHFFNPVHKMKLVELVLGLATQPRTVALARAWCEALGKASILVNETPGLTTSRMSAMLGNEAMCMLQEGTASAEDIDTALRMGLNHPMGPLELGDLTGWDTRLSVLRYLHSTLGEKFRPNPLIVKMVAAGRLGRKTGHGVYRYDESGQRVAGSGLRASML